MRRRSVYMKSPISITISASVRSPDIAALARAAGWGGSEKLFCTINAGVDVSTLTIQGIPDYLLTLQVRGRVGGTFNGGTGLVALSKFNLDNAGGTIFGGGGKGGQGGSITIFRGTGYTATGSGGAGGRGAGFDGSQPPAMLGAASGDAGTNNAVGGPVIGGTAEARAYGGAGGAGGAIGVQGGTGAFGTYSGTVAQDPFYTTPPAGDLAGYAIDGWANVNVLAAGSILGRTR